MPAPRLQLRLTTPYQNVCSIVKDQATERPNAGFSGVTDRRSGPRSSGRLPYSAERSARRPVSHRDLMGCLWRLREQARAPGSYDPARTEDEQCR
jgi:hypothetical protein